MKKVLISSGSLIVLFIIVVGATLAIKIGKDNALFNKTYTWLEAWTAKGLLPPVDEPILLETEPISTDMPTGELEESGVVCAADEKICPDGSSVVRIGKNCEFAHCAPPDEASSTVTTSLGGSGTSGRITISPKAVISDSRCPQAVDCIWAGTVEVKTVITTPVAQGEHILRLNTSQMFGDYTINLVSVTPEKTQTVIADSSYRLTFEITKQ